MKKDIKIGEFRKFNHPEYAEKYTLSEFIKKSKTTKISKFLDRKTQESKDILHCPKCNKEADYEQQHGDAYKCGECGLNRQSFGNSLYIWDDNILVEHPDKNELKEMLKREVIDALANENYELLAELKKIFDTALGK